MQKNNCKLKTIFKKGLSFSIALALGAAATSLNLAKTAEASAPNVSGQRTVYLAGEKIDKTTGTNMSNVTHVVVTKGGMEQTVAAIDDVPALTTDVTKLQFATSDTVSGNSDSAFDVTVYDWAKIYTGTSVKAAHNAEHDAARDAIVDAMTLKIESSKNTDVTAISTLLKKGELQTIDGDKIDNVDYVKHNGKEVQIKLKGVVCKLGTLEVTRKITGVELVSGPTENCYLAGEKINLDGLSLNVLYEVGDTAVVKWTKETEKNFFYSNTDVKQDTEIKNEIKDITVTYGGKTTEDKFSLYVVSTQSKEATGIASVRGTFAELGDVNAVALSEDSESYTKLKSAFAENAQVIFAYDIKADYEVSVGKMRVALNVGKNYAGQVVTVKHLANDEIETFVDKVDEDGNVTVSVDSLSPFMIVLGATEEDKAAAAETEQKNAEEAAKSEAAKSEAAKSTAASKSASSSIKTGDASVVAFSVFGFVALISAAVLAFMKKNRKNFEK